MVRREGEKMLRKAESKSDRVIEAEEGDLSKLFGIAMDGATVSEGPARPATPPPRQAGKPAGKPRRKPLREKTGVRRKA